LVRLLAIESPEELLLNLEPCLAKQSVDDSVRRTLSTAAQEDRHTFLPIRAEGRGRNSLLSFSSDDISLGGPPYAWVLLWNGKDSDIYGEHVPEALRRSGYVMWDEHRCVQTGMKDILPEQWKAATDLVEQIELYYGWNPLE
jgi:hypothetical protein